MALTGLEAISCEHCAYSCVACIQCVCRKCVLFCCKHSIPHVTFVTLWTIHGFLHVVAGRVERVVLMPKRISFNFQATMKEPRGDHNVNEYAHLLPVIDFVFRGTAAWNRRLLMIWKKFMLQRTLRWLSMCLKICVDTASFSFAEVKFVGSPGIQAPAFHGNLALGLHSGRHVSFSRNTQELYRLTRAS